MGGLGRSSEASFPCRSRGGGEGGRRRRRLSWEEVDGRQGGQRKCSVGSAGGVSIEER